MSLLLLLAFRYVLAGAGAATIAVFARASPTKKENTKYFFKSAYKETVSSSSSFGQRFGWQMRIFSFFFFSRMNVSLWFPSSYRRVRCRRCRRCNHHTNIVFIVVAGVSTLFKSNTVDT